MKRSATVTTELLEEALASCAEDRSGEVPDDVDVLAGTTQEDLGVCVVTSDGESVQAGQAGAAFCLQSIAKPFTYALALSDHGCEAVDRRIDLEPSGEAFNQVSLHSGSGRPNNPLINAGALAAASVIDGDDVDARFGRILSLYSRLAGRDLRVEPGVLELERADPWRNAAITNLLREFGIVQEDPAGPVELHARQSAVAVDCAALARMGAALACGGLLPGTAERVLPEPVCRRVLSVMATCGMYDDTGRWMADVGLPAKSGVGGGILAVSPGRLAIATFSARLDAHGASVRGAAVCRYLSAGLGLHMMQLA